MGVAYATRRDVYRYGLPRGTLAADARPVASVTPATDTFELDGHGFDDGDVVLVRAFEGGSLPAPLVAGTRYHAIRESDSTFKLSATNGGPAIDITSAGSQVAVAGELPFDEVLEFYSRFVDPFLPHGVPLVAPYPVFVTGIVAQLAAKMLLHLAGEKSVSVDEAELAAKAQLERWAKGQPLRDEAATASTNLAITDTLSRARDPRGWSPGGSGRIP